MAQPELDLGGLLDALQEQDLSQLLETASSLLQGASNGNAQQPTPDSAPPLDPALLVKLTKLFSLLNRSDPDPRADLLRALRPLVSETRRERIDVAARMLQLARLLPRLRELDL